MIDTPESKNYEGDHYNTIASEIISELNLDKIIHDHEIANLEEAIADGIRHRCRYLIEDIDKLKKENTIKDKALRSIVQVFEKIIWGEDHEYTVAGLQAEAIAISALSGKEE